MTIRIESLDENAPPPRRCTTTLSCDIRSSLICRRFMVLAFGSHIEDMGAATKAGWLVRQTTGERQFICPECVG